MARATARAAAATARANEAAAKAMAEPNQRAADLASFREIRDDMQRRLERVEERERSLRGLVRAFSRYVSDLTAQMRSHGMEPPAPPDEVREYYRTGA
ncbi:hypothetical protein RM780_04075 [Streptomyces sp. DSM 44917]|uniref:Uncharacterized protein n=1 Tax=Streptomyces boetiae TaxID=3075541 RepID=A0ABU2L3J8_9ACTN|nr:hypothetical protein [Streptomyces sp. DSM 44917]MDT0306140.1 hypothetical protein [Streptomyces sp. DSM 44917]